jgi:GNAT superfamily N-acetyltransferase
MGNVGRRLESLTLDNVDDLPYPCRSCVFWELDHVAADRAQEAGNLELEKEAWLSATLLEWGSCGLVSYADDVPVGYVLFAPPAYVPRAAMFPTSPIGADAVQLVTARVIPELRGTGLGRALVQAAARNLVRRGVRAVEAFGIADVARDGVSRTDNDTETTCLLPAGFLLAVGFKTIRPHRRWPRLRLDLRGALTLSDEVEVALDRLIETVRPEPALAPGAARGQLARSRSWSEPVWASSCEGR